jgi:glucose-1-phosphate adenylyltransferase
VGFQEKPKADPVTIPGQPDKVLASMGNYLFNTAMLKPILQEDAGRESDHDFGKTILPAIYKEKRVFAYNFAENAIPGRAPGEQSGYWRDIGTLGAYYFANMDLKNPSPEFNLYNREWPLHTAPFDDPPAKFVLDEAGRKGEAVHAIVCEGSIISGARVQDSIVARNVFVHSYSFISDSILMDGVDIGRHCRIRKAIIDKGVRIPPNTEIGYDSDRDRERFHVDPESGLVVIPKQNGPA